MHYRSKVKDLLFKPLSKCLNFNKNKLNIFLDNGMNVNKKFYPMISSSRQNVNFIKIYYKKHHISIFLENVNKLKNN